MARIFKDETGFAIIDNDGNVFGQCHSVYFVKTVDRDTAALIISPDDACQRPGQHLDDHSITPQELSINEVRQIVVDTSKTQLIIYDEYQPRMRYYSHQVSTIHKTAELIKAQSPDDWIIKTEKEYLSAFIGPVFFGIFLGIFLFLIGHYATELEAGRDVQPVKSFRHRSKSKMAISAARTLGTNGVKILTAALACAGILWTIWGLIHADTLTTFNLTSQLVRKREREKQREIEQLE